MPDEARDAIVRELTLKPLTPLTITDRRRLHAELRITRARGYSIDDEEIVLGVRCVGAPVKDSSGEVRGAISVAGPAWRLTRERLELLGPEVAEAARRIGAQLSSSATPVGNDSESTVRAIPGPWAFHGAHPVATSEGSVYWADVLAPAVRVWDAQGDRQLFSANSPIVALLRGENGLIVVSDQGAIEWRSGQSTPHPWPEGKTLAACSGADGVIWVAVGLPEAGSAIGQLQSDGRLKTFWRIGEPVAALCCWGEDGSVFATVPQSGAILVMTPGQSSVRRLATLPRGSGRLGGLAFDDQGGIWTALCDGWSVVRFTMEGQLDRVIGLPVPCATDVAFMKRDGSRELVITTQRQSVPLDTLSTAPMSGQLLVARL
jgi:hypothetical protein